MASRPWSPIEIEVKLASIIESQDDAIADLKDLGDQYAEARRAYEVLKSQTFITAKVEGKSTDQLALAKATLAAADLRFAKDLAEGRLKAQHAVCRTLESQGDSCRSLCRSARDLTDGPGFGSSSRG